MRVALLSLSLLLAPLALVPVAAAETWYCWQSQDAFCCIAPDPAGEPGSPAYFATSTAGNGWITTCATTDRGVVLAFYAVACLVEGRC